MTGFKEHTNGQLQKISGILAIRKEIEEFSEDTISEVFLAKRHQKQDQRQKQNAQLKPRKTALSPVTIPQQ